MSLKRLKEFAHTITFRLTLWYTFLFTTGALLLFALSYFQFRTALRQRDRELIGRHTEEYAAAYRTGGESALRHLVNDENERGEKSYFLRLLGPDDAVRFVHHPDRWPGLELHPNPPSSRGYQWIRLADRRGERPYEFAILTMPDKSMLQVGRSIAVQADSIDRFKRIFWNILMPVVFLGIAAGSWLTIRTLRPVRQLIHSVQTILRTGQLSERVSPGKVQDELQQLVVLFNQMLDKNEKLIRGMHEALDSVAHDLRTPMTRFRGNTELALKSATPASMEEALANGLEQSEQILQTLDTLMDISEAETGAMKLKRAEFRLADLLRQVTEIYSYLAEEKRMSVAMSCPEDLVMTGDRGRLGRVVANLLDNAIKYSPDGGRVTLEAGRRAEEIVIEVHDTGIGMAPDELPRIWDRLYRADPSRHERGLGLGLTLVKAIVQAHQGRIAVDSRVGQGSVFTLHFPPHNHS